MAEATGSDNNINNNNQVVSLDGGLSPVSFQQYQYIYNQITKQTENISQSYDDALLVKFHDIEHLCEMMGQHLAQYDTKNTNCLISVFYTNNMKDTYSSIERFRSSNQGTSNIVESITIEFNVLIIMPLIQKPQSLKITIRLVSRTALQARMDSEILGPMPKIFSIMGNRTALVTIEYIDYVTAKTTMSFIEEWFKTIETNSRARFIRNIQSKSHYIPRFLGLASILIVAAGLFQAAGLYVKNENSVSLGQFIVIAMAAIFLANRISHYIGEYAERRIDRWSELSYISITKGDELNVKKIESKNSKNIYASMFAATAGLAVSIAIKVLSEIIVKTLL